MTYDANQSPETPQWPQWYPPPIIPPKKTHRFRNLIVLPFAGLVALIVLVTVMASGGGGIEKGASSAGDSSQPQSRNDPRAITPGVAFTIGKHRLDAGWKITYDEFMGSTLAGTVINVSSSASTAAFSVKYLRGNEVLANFQCYSDELEPKQSQAIECVNTVTTTKRVTGWTGVTAEATL